MAGGVGRFAARNKKPLSQPDRASATPSTTAPDATEPGNNDALKPSHLAPASPGTFASFEDRPATGGSHGFNSIGMNFGEGGGAVDDGFSGFDNTNGFGGGFGMGEGTMGYGMEVEGVGVGGFSFGGMDGTNDGGMDQGGNEATGAPDAASTNQAGAGLRMFRKKTAPDAASAPVRTSETAIESAIGDAPQEQAESISVPPKNDEAPLEAPANEGTNESVANLSNFDIGLESVAADVPAPNPSVPAAPETELLNENQFMDSFGNTEFSAIDSHFDTEPDNVAKVPESISGEGEDEVQDDLTASSYYSAKDAIGVDAVMEEEKQENFTNAEKSEFGGEKWDDSKNQGVDDGVSKTANPATVLEAGGAVATEAPKQQALFRPMTAPRVSMSPPNVVNRSGKSIIAPRRNSIINPKVNSSKPASNQGRISPARNVLATSAGTFPRRAAMKNPNATSNAESLALKKSTSQNTNQARASSPNTVGNIVANPSNVSRAMVHPNNGGTDTPADSATALSNDNSSIDDQIDDNRSIVIPGFAPVAAEAAEAVYEKSNETTNQDQFGTDTVGGFNADVLDASMDLNLAPMDVTMEDVQKNAPAPTMADSTVLPSQPKGFNRNFSVAQNSGLSATKPSFMGGNSGKSGPIASKPSLVDRSASATNNVQRSRQFSFARSVQKAKNAANSKQSDCNSFGHTIATNVPAVAARNTTTITPPGRGRNIRQNNETTPLTRPTMNGQEYNNSVTPDGTSTAVPTREMQKQPVTQGQTESSIDRITPGHASNYSPPPPSVANTNTTPKISNVQPQGAVNQAAAKDSQWNLSIAEASCSNLSFDELLNKFLEDIQEANDLHEQGENELLELEVDLSHAMAAALRYKGDMMDLLDDIEGAQAMADYMLAQFS